MVSLLKGEQYFLSECSINAQISKLGGLHINKNTSPPWGY